MPEQALTLISPLNIRVRKAIRLIRVPSKKFRTDVTQMKNTDVTQMALLWLLRFNLAN
jgi:hypothetical protein